MGKIDELIGAYEKTVEIANDCLTSSYNCKVDAEKQMAIKIIENLKQLKSSLPTQQDKVAVPEFIKNTMEQYDSLQEMLTEEYYSNCTDEINDDKVQCWIGENFDLLCRAWLDLSDINDVVVPPMIDKYLNVGNKAQKLASLVSNKYTMLDSDADSELKQWLRQISMDDLLSLVNGYTVEKEQLYCVEVGNLVFVSWGSGGVSPTMITKQIMGWGSYVKKVEKDKAEEIAEIIGGRTVPVEEDK